MSILSGLGGLGLGGLEDMDIFDDEEKEKKAKAKADAARIDEKDIVFDRTYECPVCYLNFPTKTVKTGKAKLLGTDPDLRPKYDIIDPAKYDVILCPRCGYAALSRFFDKITQPQAKLVKEKISINVHIPEYDDPICTYKEALERYKLALVNAVVKKSRASEKAYICLKGGWVARGYRESVLADPNPDLNLIAELEQQEDEYLQNAYKGFVEARQSEGFPMCGMDEATIDYLLAVLAARFKKFDVASKMLASVLTSPAANPRMKDRARDLKEEILKELKKK